MELILRLLMSTFIMVVKFGCSDSQWTNALVECEEGFFPCGNSSQCVAQEFQCDTIAHCDNEADEVDCSIDEGWNTEFDRHFRIPVVKGTVTSLDECALPFYPEGCKCTKLTQLDCSGLNLTHVPLGIPSNVTRLLLKDNMIENINGSMFANFPSLVYLNLMGNKIQEIPTNAFHNLQLLHKLYLTGNQISHIQEGAFNGMTDLSWLFMNQNKMPYIGAGMFRGLNLVWLDLRENEISDLRDGEIFGDVPSLKWLDLEGNNISSLRAKSLQSDTSLSILILSENGMMTLHKDVFKTQVNLTELDLSTNQISELPQGVFDPLTKLQILKLQNNPLTLLPIDLFGKLTSLVELQLEGMQITNIDTEMFEKLQALERVHFLKFDYCRYARHVRHCTPRSDGISSFENLLKNMILRVFVWTIGLVTTIGNVWVLISRAFMKTENKVHTAVVISLCTADLLMGIYLLIIGAYDVRFRDSYNKYAIEWVTSHTCKISGFLGMISSEVSVLTLTFISLERYFIIVYPYSFQRIKARTAVTVLIVIWLFGVVLAGLPVIPVDYFESFYGSNGVCLPLHLHEPWQKGWEYSAFVFLGINTTAFFIIAVAYTGMFLSIRKTRRAAAQCGIKGDMAYAKRFFFIILTDSLCWLPIAVLKTMSLCGFIISETLYGWIVVFVLPINSALNPILYTLSTTPFAMWFMRQLKRGKLQSSSCYIGKRLDISELGRDKTEELDGYTSYTNVTKRASAISTNNGPLSFSLEPINGKCVTNPPDSLSSKTTATVTAPPEVVDNDICSMTVSSVPVGNRRRFSPIILITDVME